MKLLQDKQGNTSSTRLMSLLTVLCSLGIALYSIHFDKLTTQAVSLIIGMLSLGLGVKVVGKKLEK